MPLPRAWLDAPIAKEIASLGLACVESENPMLVLRAAAWRNTLVRIGLPIPFWAVHDLGLCFVADPASAPINPRPAASIGLNPSMDIVRKGWIELLTEIRKSEVIERARAWRLGDELVAILLIRVLGPSAERLLGGQRRSSPLPLPLDAELYRDIGPQLPELMSRADSTNDVRFFEHFGREHLRISTAVEMLDLDTLRVLGMLGTESSLANAQALVDMLSVLASPEANDVVNFSLDLLPSILETKRATGAQTFAVDGYAGLARHGTLDSLVLSELAFDDDLFAQRFLENEVFYYAREKQHTTESREHYLLVDASASMRGRRSVFARGLALALSKKLLLRGEDVSLRFFDSKLHDVVTAKAGRGRDPQASLDVPYILSFKGEHGRNYGKVFAMLANELGRRAQRNRRPLVLYILTHAECHVPLETMDRLREHAALYGVFLLPSTGQLDLEYLDRLTTVQIVDERALGDRTERAHRALDIVEHAAQTS